MRMLSPENTPHSSPKFIVVTGGVVSGLGKGIAAASIGKLYSSAGLKVIPIKLDGYLNVDPGTMNPYEHGEVFVLDDGGEVDMDFGHYERFLNVHPKITWNLTMGKVFDHVRQKERKGDYLGKTVQFVPHVTNAIKEMIFRVVNEEHPDVIIIEVGGTVGDMENELYVESMRQLKKDVGEDHIAYVHLTYVPVLHSTKEEKSKPTQQSVNLLRQRGIQPDIILGRCEQLLTDSIKERISTFCDVPKEAVITGLDVDNVYKIPLVYHEEGILSQLNQKLGLEANPQLVEWGELVRRMKESPSETHIAICGKYTKLEDSYASVLEAIRHAGAHHHVKPVVHWIETTHIENGSMNAEDALRGMDGVIVPGGFGSRGAEGKIQVIEYARTHNVPYLGLCYGLQLATIEYARNACGMDKANTTENDPHTPFPVIDILPEKKSLSNMGGTLRLGGHDILILPNTKASEMFGTKTRLRFRHRFEVNPEFVERLEKNGLVFSGRAPHQPIMQILELPHHPFFMATQAHPELTSKLDKPCPFFDGFVEACTKTKDHNEKIIVSKPA